MNYDETDIDCGGPLCPSCQLGEVRQRIKSFNFVCVNSISTYTLGMFC